SLCPGLAFLAVVSRNPDNHQMTVIAVDAPGHLLEVGTQNRPAGLTCVVPGTNYLPGFFVQTLQKTFDRVVTKVPGIVDVAVEILGGKVRDESEFWQAVEPISGE